MKYLHDYSVRLVEKKVWRESSDDIHWVLVVWPAHGQRAQSGCTSPWLDIAPLQRFLQAIANPVFIPRQATACELNDF
jgi:hypothetical protein